jgi:hypothetical protein
LFKAVGILCIFVLTGLGAPGLTQGGYKTQTSSVVETVAPLQPQDFSLSGIQIGDSAAKVRERLGEPEETSILHGIGLPLWIYKQRGIEVGFTARDGTPIDVILIHASPVFKGTTIRGIGIGSSKTDVIKAYGTNPTSSDEKSIEFLLQDNRVQRIIIRKDL